MRGLAIALLASLALASGLHAQKSCNKGIPCGNSCISATKVCRNSGSPATDVRIFSQSYPWVASPRGRTYYANVPACKAFLKLKSLVFFDGLEAAEAKGLARSSQKGC